MSISLEALKTIINNTYTCSISLRIDINTFHFYNGGHAMSNYCGNALLSYIDAASGGHVPHLTVRGENLRKVRDVMSQEDYWAKSAFIVFARNGLIDVKNLYYGEDDDDNFHIAQQKLKELITPGKDHGLPKYYQDALQPNRTEFGVPPLFLQPYIEGSGPNTLENRLIILPVVASDGATYDLETLIRALENNWPSPMTNKPFEKKSIRISRAMSMLLNACLDLHPVDPVGILLNKENLISMMQQKIRLHYSEGQMNNAILKLNQLIKHDDAQCPLCQKQAKLIETGRGCIKNSRRIFYLGTMVGPCCKIASQHYSGIAKCLPGVMKATVTLKICSVGCVVVGAALMMYKYGDVLTHEIHHKGVVPNIGWRGDQDEESQASPYNKLSSLLIGQSTDCVVAAQPGKQFI